VGAITPGHRGSKPLAVKACLTAGEVRNAIVRDAVAEIVDDLATHIDERMGTKPIQSRVP
jgi:hypothetical protein